MNPIFREMTKLHDITWERFRKFEAENEGTLEGQRTEM